MVNLPSVFSCRCFDLFLFCFVLFVFIYLFFLGGGAGSGSQFILHTTAFRVFQFCGRNFAFNYAFIWGYRGGGVVCDPPPPPNQELHLVLMLPYKYRLFNYFNYSKKLQRFMQDTRKTTSFLLFSFLLNIRCCTQSICLKSI